MDERNPARNRAASVTELLDRIAEGNKEAQGSLIDLVYKELRRLAASYLRAERPNHTLQPTALVNEAYLKIFGSGPVKLRNRSQFFAVAALQMRRILVDHARAAKAHKRGGGLKIGLDGAGQLMASSAAGWEELNEALDKLQKVDPRAAEVVDLKFFGGLSEDEIARWLGTSTATVQRDWHYARLWLFSQLTSSSSAPVVAKTGSLSKDAPG
jgi:RNA polymerase sigma factor (TIGR02999 family)